MKQLLLLSLLSSTAIAATPNTTTFGLDLYKELSKKPGNVFISPYSITTALAMTSAGARGKTLEEMLSTLHLDKNLHSGMNELRKALVGDGKNQPLLSTANRLWGKSGTPYRSEFLELTEKNYGASLTPLDYAADPEKARTTINSWVEEQTHDKIKDLLPQGSVRRETDLVLTNAIYFKGDWDHEFEKKRTIDEDFKAPTGTVKAKFLHRQAHYGYAENENFQAVRIPYKGNALAMTIYLPRSGKPTAITEKEINFFQNNFMHTEVNLSFPKFKMTKEATLEKILPKLGMKLAFTPKADFTGMREVKKGDALSIDFVIHKAFIEVDEKGTEAAAATAVGMIGTSAMIHEPKIQVFHADHPFLFTIDHLPTNTVLFLGRLENP